MTGCSRNAVLRVATLLVAGALLIPGTAAAQRRVITDADIERILPMLRSPLGRTAGFGAAAARGAAGMTDYMALSQQASSSTFDPHDWITARAAAAVVPPDTRYLQDCSREVPVAAVKIPLTRGRLDSDAFTPTAVYALAGGTAALDGARRFYAARGFTAVAAAAQGTTRLLAPDSSLVVSIHRANPHAGEPLLRPACSRAAGATLELALFRPSWSASDAGWTRQRYEAELARHGLEHREYWAVVGGLAAVRAMVLSPKWGELSAAEQALVSPNVAVYLRHRARLDPLLVLLDTESLDR
jgi:hypothetical protein